MGIGHNGTKLIYFKIETGLLIVSHTYVYMSYYYIKY